MMHTFLQMGIVVLSKDATLYLGRISWYVLSDTIFGCYVIIEAGLRFYFWNRDAYFLALSFLKLVRGASSLCNQETWYYMVSNESKVTK